MSRNSFGFLERIVSNGRDFLSRTKTKTATLLATSAMALGATGPCGITSSTTLETPPTNQSSGDDIENRATRAREYNHSMGFWVDGEVTPKEVGEDIINYVGEKASGELKNILLDYLDINPLIGVIGAVFYNIPNVGYLPTPSYFNYRVKTEGSGSWQKNIAIDYDQPVLFMLEYYPGDYSHHLDEGLSATIFNETDLLGEHVGDIPFLDANEETNSPPNVYILKKPINLEEFLYPDYLNYLSQTLSIGSKYGDPVIITIRPKSQSPPGNPPRPPENNDYVGFGDAFCDRVSHNYSQDDWEFGRVVGAPDGIRGSVQQGVYTEPVSVLTCHFDNAIEDGHGPDIKLHNVSFNNDTSYAGPFLSAEIRLGDEKRGYITLNPREGTQEINIDLADDFDGLPQGRKYKLEMDLTLRTKTEDCGGWGHFTCAQYVGIDAVEVTNGTR